MATARFQVVTVTPRAGMSKGNKAYSLLILDGVFTDADGTMSTGELVLFADRDGKLPAVQVGVTYEPITKTFVNREKKLSAGVFELKPLVAQVKAA